MDEDLVVQLGRVIETEEEGPSQETVFSFTYFVFVSFIGVFCLESLEFSEYF